MDTAVPLANSWTFTEEDLHVWSLGQTPSGPCYALLAPYGWVRLALPAPEDDNQSLDWTAARAKLDQTLAAETPPPDGWTVALVAEAEMETVEFGPLAPAPDTPPPDFARLNASVWRVRAAGEMMGWLIADLDSQEATLILPWDHASTPAWRNVAREATLTRLSRLPGRARWRLRIVGEEQVGQESIPNPASKPSSSPAPTPRAAVPAFNLPSMSALGARAPLPRSSIIGIVLALVLCVVLAFAINRLRQSTASSGQIPALSVPNAPVPSGPVKVGSDAVVVSTTLTPLRRDPGDNAPVLLLVAEGQSAPVIDGPQAINGRNWWKVRVDKTEGWLPETTANGTKVIAGK
jgi:hypothetical protein